MNRSLYVVEAAGSLADLAPLVIQSHFHTGDGGGDWGGGGGDWGGGGGTRKQDA